MMLAGTFMILAQQIAGAGRSGRELSQSSAHHAMASTHTWLDLVLVAAGVIVVVVTTFYTVLYLIRPGEVGETHIKRRILEDGREGSR
jgi:predicted transcriptional regulator